MNDDSTAPASEHDPLEFSARERSQWRRAAALVALVAAALLGNLLGPRAFEAVRNGLDTNMARPFSDLFLPAGVGLLLAQPGLLGAVMGLMPGSSAVRLPLAVFLLAIGALAFLWGAPWAYDQQGPSPTAGVFIAIVGGGIFLVNVAVAGGARRALGLRLRLVGAPSEAGGGRFRFQLWHLFLWTTMTAAVLATARFVLPGDRGPSSIAVLLPLAVLPTAMFGAVSVVTNYLALAAVLGRRADAVLALILAWFLGPVGFALLVTPTMGWSMETSALFALQALHTGWLACVLLVAAVFRRLGYELRLAAPGGATSNRTDAAAEG